MLGKCEAQESRCSAKTCYEFYGGASMAANWFRAMSSQAGTPILRTSIPCTRWPHLVVTHAAGVWTIEPCAHLGGGAGCSIAQTELRQVLHRRLCAPHRKGRSPGTISQSDLIAPPSDIFRGIDSARCVRFVDFCPSFNCCSYAIAFMVAIKRGVGIPRNTERTHSTGVLLGLGRERLGMLCRLCRPMESGSYLVLLWVRPGKKSWPDLNALSAGVWSLEDVG